jgi:hypothetical protein
MKEEIDKYLYHITEEMLEVPPACEHFLHAMGQRSRISPPQAKNPPGET